MIALVIPIIDNWDITKHCIQRAVANSRHGFELIIIDNGSDENYEKRIKKLLKPHILYKYVKNDTNLGVIASFNQGLQHAVSDIICFIHNDVLLQEPEWEKKIEHYFDNDSRLGLAGLLGGTGVSPDGGRINVLSNMQGAEWGKCDGCHPIAALHHGALLEGISPATVLDGVGLFFRRACLEQIQKQTTALDTDVRAPHHWYDRNLTCNALKLGWHVAILGVGFDHWSGATANSSSKYHTAAEEWLAKHPEWSSKFPDKNLDEKIYWTGENQFRQEWDNFLPVNVLPDYSLVWRQQP